MLAGNGVIRLDVGTMWSFSSFFLNRAGGVSSLVYVLNWRGAGPFICLWLNMILYCMGDGDVGIIYHLSL